MIRLKNISMSNHNKFNILLYIFIFFSIIILNVILLTTPPADGYEVSIYGSIPWIFWLIFIIILVFALYGIICQVFNYKRINFITYLSIIFILYIIILLLTLSRGYLWAYDANWDSFGHLWNSKYILEYGQIRPNDWYPIVHILLASLKYFGIPLKFSCQLIMALSSLLYILGMYSLSQIISKNRSEQVLFFIFSLPLLFASFQTVLMPSYITIYLLPFVIYCLYKYCICNQKRYAVILFVLCTTIIFFHPLTSIIMILIITFVYFIAQYSNKFSEISLNYFMNAILIFIVVLFLFWMLQGSVFGGKVAFLYDSIFDVINGKMSSTGLMDDRITKISDSRVNFGMILDMLYKHYCILFTYILMGIMFVFYSLNELRKKVLPEISKIFLVQFIISIIYMIFLMSGLLVCDIIRAAQYMLVVTPIFCGITLINIWRTLSEKHRLYVIIIISLIIVHSACLGVFLIYPSPINGNSNPMISEHQENGVSWYIDNVDLKNFLINNYVELRLWYVYYMVPACSVYGFNTISFSTPSHFGYLENSFFGDIINYEKVYMLTDDRMKQHYAAVKGRKIDINQYTASDFYRLNQDPTVIKIYNNEEFNVWIANY